MSDEKNKSPAVSAEDSTVRRKKPTLSQQVKEQAEKIEALMVRLQQKELELISLNQQSRLIDELSLKLQKTEQVIKAKTAQTQAQDHTIEVLRRQLMENGQQVTSTHEQAALIDELTTRLQEVEIKLAATSLQNKHMVAQGVVKTHIIAGMALGLLPAPLFDIAALTGTQVNLLRSLSRHYGVDFDEKVGKAVLASLIGGSVPVVTVVSLSSFAKLIPGIGTLGGGISMTVLSGAMTYATGQVFIRHFEAGGTFRNFDAKHWRTFFREQLEEGKIQIKSKLERSGSASASG
ncbi:MAG: DUF697 domain-containing protein [Thiothrix sp.]